MKRIILVCEGETELAFCNKVLREHLHLKGVTISGIITKGIKPWSSIKDKIVKLLRQDRAVFVSTFYDYYGIYAKHGFPNWETAKKIKDKQERLSALEYAMKADLPNDLQSRFIPYLQLHEFESLLFIDIEIFRKEIPSHELKLKDLQQIFEEYPNPEMINQCRESSPSHRLLHIIKGYDKIVYGNILIEAIGLNNVRAKCPRFNHWIGSLEGIGEKWLGSTSG